MTSRLALVNGNGIEMDYPKAPRYLPKRGHILVRRREREASASGLVLPGNMAKSLQEGEVVLVGAARYFDNGTMVPVDVAVGDIVLYSEPAALQIDPHDPDMVLLFEDNVLAKRIQ
jgi:chaperonin GroES